MSKFIHRSRFSTACIRPEGRAADYPIPVVLTEADIREAIDGRMVTRVVYLEQPQLAAMLDPLRREIPQSVNPADNALQEADRLGRPMIIVRIGGRTPSGDYMPYHVLWFRRWF